jgi:hypothetical protein
MRLCSTFYSDGSNLAPGWWATIEHADSRRRVYFLWNDEAGPDFDDLAALIAEQASLRGLAETLQLAHENARLVRRTKAITHPSA